MAQSALIAAFLAGLFGGLHCVAMCGGWIAVATGATPAGAGIAVLPARTLRRREAASHAGRLCTYVLVGTALGAAGGGAFALAFQPVQTFLYAAANVVLLVLALALARGAARGGAIEGLGLALFRRVAPLVQPLTTNPGLPARFALGLLWGLTPCALVYGVAPVALLSGSAWNGAAVMAAFGLGTLPNLVGAGWLWRRLSRRPLGGPWRYAAATLVAAFALVGLYRALFVPEALGQGPFCLVPPR